MDWIGELLFYYKVQLHTWYEFWVVDASVATMSILDTHYTHNIQKQMMKLTIKWHAFHMLNCYFVNIDSNHMSLDYQKLPDI